MIDHYDFIIGIDPGSDGALAILDHHGSCTTYRFKTERRAMIAAVAQMGRRSFIVMEDVHALYGAQASSTFTFGKEVGRILGILEANDCEPDLYVAPTKWQAYVTNSPERPSTKGLDAKTAAKVRSDHKKALKAESIRAARDAFAGCLGDNTMHDGVADALNIARFGHLYLIGGVFDMAAKKKPMMPSGKSGKKSGRKGCK